MRLMLFLIAALLPAGAEAAARYAAAETVTVCPATPEEASPPVPSSPGCEETPVWRADPQGTFIWLIARIDAPDSLEGVAAPVGLFVSAKASSEAFINGVRIGSNGQPAADRAGETPGRMDAVFYVPPEALLAGENQIALRLSSHHGLLRLANPVHLVALGPYEDSGLSPFLGPIWPTLLPFGALLAGAIYFAAAGAAGGWRLNVTLLSLAASFAAAQLIAEAWRRTAGYDYPTHDLRLVLIAFSSLGFGLCLLAHVIARFARRRRAAVFAGGAALAVAAVLLARGFDAKTGFAVMAPALYSLVIVAMAARRGEAQAALYALALFLFVGSIFVFQGAFLDVVFFYEAAALLLALFILEARAFARERALRESEAARAKELERALERAARKEGPQRLRIAGAGSIDFAPVDEIAFCKGAGDYVEIALKDGRTLLHSGNLADLENELPQGFLRVHRSYLVNTAFVSKLTREPSGVGRLTLTTGAETPVSRRIMPKVRSALAYGIGR